MYSPWFTWDSPPSKYFTVRWAPPRRRLACRQLGLGERAAELLQGVLALAPHHAEAMLLLADIYDEVAPLVLVQLVFPYAIGPVDGMQRASHAAGEALQLTFGVPPPCPGSGCAGHGHSSPTPPPTPPPCCMLLGAA